MIGAIHCEYIPSSLFRSNRYSVYIILCVKFIKGDGEFFGGPVEREDQLEVAHSLSVFEVDGRGCEEVLVLLKFNYRLFQLP